MGSSTVILILKSLLPLLKEFVLKDKLLRELLLENKIATILSGCVLFLFILFMHVSEIATNSAHANAELKQENAYLSKGNDELRVRVERLEEELRNLRNPPAKEGPTEHHAEEASADPPPQPAKPVVKRKPKPKAPSLRSKIENRFKSFQ